MNAAPSPSQIQSQENDTSLRRSARSWNFFRLVLGVTGASLVILPVTSGNNYVLSVVGLVMFVAAILLPSTRRQTRVDAKAHELGAIAVVHGGRIRFKNSPSAVQVRLFVGSKQVSVFDSNLHLLFEIPASEILSAQVTQAGNRWVLELKWAAYTANFFYRGILAERRARKAEGAVRLFMRPAFPAPLRRRAAGA
jgi:hypothetical protein